MTQAQEPSLKELDDLLSALALVSPSKARGLDVQKVRVYSAIITALDAASSWYYKASVKLAGHDVAIPDVPWLEAAFPRGVVVGQWVWVLSFGTEKLILGPQHVSGHPTPACRVRRSLDQSINNNADTPITFTSSMLDTSVMFTVGDPTKITCVRKGLYAVGFSGAFVATNTTGRRVFAAWKNNTDIIVRQELPPSSTILVSHNGHSLVNLDAGDYVELKAFQTSGAALNVQSSQTGEYYLPQLSVIWVGPPIAP